MKKTKKEKPERFKMLKTIIVLLRVLGWVMLVGGLAAAIEIMIAPQLIDKLGWMLIYHSAWLIALVVLIGAVMYTMIFFALAEGLQVFLSIECNTRKLRELLDKK